MENNYMILFSRGARVPLLAKDGVYTFKFGEHEIYIPSCIEQYIACDMWQKDNNTENFCWWMRAYCDEDISTKDIKLAINQFFKDHPLTPLETFKFSDIPLYATEEQELAIILPRGCLKNYITISRSTERIWLKTILNRDWVYYDALKRKIQEYIVAYGYCLTRSSNTDVAEGIAESFLRQHGIYRENGKICFHKLIFDSMWPRKKSTTSKVFESALSLLFGSWCMWSVFSQEENMYIGILIYIFGSMSIMASIGVWCKKENKQETAWY